MIAYVNSSQICYVFDEWENREGWGYPAASFLGGECYG